MSKPKRPEDFLKIPRFKGGDKAMGDFISKNLKYPQEALTNKIEGTVEVAFAIDGLGRVTEAVVKNGLGYGCDEEALRVVRLLVFEKAINRGLKTTTRKSIKINFKLAKAQVNPQTVVNYSIVPSKTVPSAIKPKPEPMKYNITLNINRD